MLPHTANAAETRFSLEVLAIDANSRHVKGLTIFQLSSRRKCKKTGAASRFSWRSTPSSLLGVSISASEGTSITALLRPSADTNALSAEKVHQATSDHCQGIHSGLLFRRSHCVNATLILGRLKNP